MLKYFGLTGTALTAWVAVATCSCMTLFGFDQSVFGGVIVTADFLEQMGHPSANLIGTITSIYDVGCFFGAVTGPFFGSRVGRKRSVILGTIVMMIRGILQMTAFNVPHMIVGRIVAGLGNGLNTAAAPVWQSETSKIFLRGKLVVLGLVLNVAGFCFANWLTFGFYFVGGSVTWRFPLAFQLVFGIVILGTAPWLPESPRWLVSKGRLTEAREVLASLEANGATDTTASVLREQQEISDAYAKEIESQLTWWELISGRSNDQSSTLRRFLLGLGAQIIVQLSGINATSYYLPTVLQSPVNLTEVMSRLLTAVNGIPYTIARFVGMMLIDRWGRRGAMLIGTSGCAVAYLALTVLVREIQFSTGTQQYHYGIGATAMILVYYVFFGAGWQGTAWLYNTEINSLQMRMKGASASVAAQWASIPIIYVLYPETANRRLEDMDHMFNAGLAIAVFQNKDAIMVRRPEQFTRMDEEHMRRIGEVVDEVDEKPMACHA